MNIQNFLNEALKEQFKANAIVNEIERQINKIAEQTIFKKYENTPLFRDNLEFELFGVRSQFWAYYNCFRFNKVDITLAYTCKSKLPKDKRERLQKVKDYYIKEKLLQFSNYKIPIWHSLHYKIELENILNKNINLIID